MVYSVLKVSHQVRSLPRFYNKPFDQAMPIVQTADTDRKTERCQSHSWGDLTDYDSMELILNNTGLILT